MATVCIMTSGHASAARRGKTARIKEQRMTEASFLYLTRQFSSHFLSENLPTHVGRFSSSGDANVAS